MQKIIEKENRKNRIIKKEKVEFASTMFSACCDLPLHMLFVKLIDPALMLSEAGDLVYWFLASLEVLWCKPMLDALYAWPLATCVEQKVIHSLWLPLLGLALYRKDQAVLSGWLLPEQG